MILSALNHELKHPAPEVEATLKTKKGTNTTASIKIISAARVTSSKSESANISIANRTAASSGTVVDSHSSKATRAPMKIVTGNFCRLLPSC